MTVYEAGIMRNGLLLVFREYHATSSVDQDLKSALFSALEIATRNTFGDSLDIIQLKTLSIIYYNSPKNEGKFVAYAICDRDTDYKLMKELLHKILDTFLEEYAENLDSPIKTHYDSFRNKIDSFFKDLSEKPDERAKSLFG